MTVVSDTSILINFVAIQHEQMLLRLFGDIYAPSAVQKEFIRLTETRQRFANLAFPSFVKVVGSSADWPAVPVDRRLHLGEDAALRLALHLHADAVLMDETAGRLVAQGHGLKTIGLLGILIRAKERGWVSEVLPLLRELQDRVQFWISPKLFRHVLTLCGESLE